MRLARLGVPALSILIAMVPTATPAGASAAAQYSVDRLAGPDRFGTAVAVSQRYYPTSGVPVVYVANGLNFPDALSAAPAAARQGGPLLTVWPDAIPDVISAELNRLAPQKIVVVGGPSVVSDSVYAQLSAHAPGITRVFGPSRYDTSLAISRYAFPNGSSTKAFLASGGNFPDALAAAGAAGAAGAPVILVDGLSTTGPSAAAVVELNRLGVTNVVLAGGPSVVYPQVERGLKASFEVERYAGADRFGTSGVINRESFISAGHIFMATGLAFPDALTAAAAAGARHEPLYVVPTNCIPPYVLEDLETRGVASATLVGGPSVLGSGAASLTRCGLNDWLVKLNQVRGEANLPALVEDPRFSGDISAHIFYLEKTGQFQHVEDANSEWYTDRGALGGYSDLSSGAGLRTESWLNAPFHLAAFLNPGVNAAGAYGRYVSGEGTRWIQPGATGVLASPVTDGFPRTWPSSASVLTAEFTQIASGESPSPVSSCGSVYVSRYNDFFPEIGMPIYVEFDPSGTAVTSATAIFQRGSTILPSCVVTSATYTNPIADQQALGRAILSAYNSMFVVPRDPLAFNTTYTLTVTTNLSTVSTTVHVGNE